MPETTNPPTAAEILALEGQGLDAAVAEYICGWTKIYHSASLQARGCAPGPAKRAYTPYYSTNRRDLWRLIEAMRFLGWARTVREELNGHDMTVTWERRDGSQPRADLRGAVDEEPALLCRAALLALRGHW